MTMYQMDLEIHFKQTKKTTKYTDNSDVTCS